MYMIILLEIQENNNAINCLLFMYKHNRTTYKQLKKAEQTHKRKIVKIIKLLSQINDLVLRKIILAWILLLEESTGQTLDGIVCAE